MSPERPAPPLSRFRRRLAGVLEPAPVRRTAQVLLAAGIGFVRNNTGDQAAALSYISLISLVPLAAAFSTLLSAMFGGDAGLADAINQALPYSSPALTRKLLALVAHARAASGLGTLVFFVVAFRAYHRIEAAINRVWRIESPRDLATRIASFLMMMFWGPVVMGLIFNLRLVLKAHGATNLSLPGISRGLGAGAAFAVTALAFTMIHWRAPNVRVRFVPALVAGLGAALGIHAIRIAMASPWKFLSEIQQVYGPLAILLLLTIALYAFWIWFLFTVELAHAWQRSGRIPPRRLGHLPPPEEDGALALRLGVAVAEAFRRAEPPRTTSGWADFLDVFPDDLERVVLRLEKRGLVEVEPTSGGLRPTRDPGRIRALEIWDAVSEPRSLSGPGADLLGALEARRRELLASRDLFGATVGVDDTGEEGSGRRSDLFLPPLGR